MQNFKIIMLSRDYIMTYYVALNTISSFTLVTCENLFEGNSKVYLLYQCPDNYDLYVEYLGKLSAIIEDYELSKVALIV